ncbi:MAG: FmdE family protein [Thermodesulfobacteriota bacterium]
MKIGGWSYEEFAERVKNFHGHASPGVILGGIMVQEALGRLPEGTVFNAICETRFRLPDAVQMLTPCTAGNGRLRVLDFGRFALCLFDRTGGEGIRVFLDPRKAASRNNVMKWYFEEAQEQEREDESLLAVIREAGTRLIETSPVKLKPRFFDGKRKGGMSACPLCGERFLSLDGAFCRACQGETPYEEAARIGADPVPAGDPGRLPRPEQEWVRGNDAAAAFARAMSGEGIGLRLPPAGGRADLTAGSAGLLMVDTARLEAFNLVPGAFCASRHGGSMMSANKVAAATGAIPPYLPAKAFREAMEILSGGALFHIRPLRRAKVGILVAGAEGRPEGAEDRFAAIVRNKAEFLGCTVVRTLFAPGDREAVRNGVRELLEAGAELLVTAAGTSAASDDAILRGLTDAGAEELLSGAAVLPGAAILLARIGDVRVVGVPGRDLSFRRAAFDLVLPRLLAGVDITARDLARFGHGGICLECHHCAFPKCPFGK